MARAAEVPLVPTLRKLFPSAWLSEAGRSTGAFVRSRVVTAPSFFWTLVLGFGLGRTRSIAGLRRSFEKATGRTIEESSFYDRFTPEFVALLQKALGLALDAGFGVGRALRGPLAAFRDVLVTDSTVLRLNDLLAPWYPGSRTNQSLAALKAHVLISVRGTGKNSIKLTCERIPDGRMLTIGRWVLGHLLLFDLGYFSYRLFARIHENGGFFLSRLKANANPLIVAVNRVHRGRAVDLVGKRLRDVVDRLRRGVLDLTVEVEFTRRSYGGKERRTRMQLRVVGLRDAKAGVNHLYVTNIPPEKLAAEDIGRTYALRWEIELLFKELKSHFRMDDLPSRKRPVVEAMLLASMITLVVSRRLLHVVRKALGAAGDRVPAQRWASLVASAAQEVLAALLRPRSAGSLVATWRTMLHEAVDPNLARRGLLAAVEERTHCYAAAA